MRCQLRFAALGDSTTFGVGDPVHGGWRGWAALLADALGESYDVRFTNLAVSGGTTRDVLDPQLGSALARRPDLASLIVGVNDTMKSSWDPVLVRERLLATAAGLAGSGALLLTVRYHDHASVLGLPGWLRRPMWRRIQQLNATYDEIHAQHGGVRIDLAQRPEVATRAFWSVDRLHPSGSGHRAVARWYAELLAERGYLVVPPPAGSDSGLAPSRREDLAWLARAGLPWLARRAGDLGPWGARMALAELGARRGGELARMPALPGPDVGPLRDEVVA